MNTNEKGYYRLEWVELQRGGMHTNKPLACTGCRRFISSQDGGGDALCRACVDLIMTHPFAPNRAPPSEPGECSHYVPLGQHQCQCGKRSE